MKGSRKLQFLPESKSDLLNLYDYIAEHSSPAIANNYLSRIGRFIESLARFPERGIERNEIRRGLRVVGFEKRVSIAFRVSKEQVTILRVLYAGRDLRRHLQ